MKHILLIVFMIFAMSSCGKDKKKSNSGISYDPLSPSTVEGYFSPNGTVEISGVVYQMVSSMNGSMIQQRLYSSGIQPVMVNGTYKYRAYITGYINNPCAQTQVYPNYNNGYNNGYNQNCNVNQYQGSQTFNVTDLQFF